jgi:hypothetical protein
MPDTVVTQLLIMFVLFIQLVILIVLSRKG